MRIGSLLLIALVVSSVAFSQVRIRERIELTPRPTQDVTSRAAAISQAGGPLIAPRTGNLLIRPESVSRLGEPTPDNAYLEVSINGTVKRQVKVLPYFTVSSSFTYWYENRCTQEYAQLTHYSSYSPIELFDTIKVTKGDQLEFVYHGGLDNPTVSSYLSYRSGGATLLTLPADYACWIPGYLVERCIVSLKYEEAILLGESRYYYVVEEEGGLIIRDDADPLNPPPDRRTDVVFSVVPTSGDKLGVYYEEKQSMGNGAPLADGLIRLIGRHLDPEDAVKYKVELSAKVGDDYPSVEIQVKKPSRLGDNDIARSRRIYLDIEGKSIDVDSLCVFYGATYGIPPQFIKGQIQDECAFSKPLQKLVPSHRFEPYTTQVDVYNLRDDYGGNPFYIRGPWDTQMGTGKCVPSPQCPPEHKNVSFIPYILYPKTLWDFVYDYSQLITVDPPRGDITPEQHAIYGKRTADGRMDFGRETYPRMQRMYDQLYELYDDQLGGTDKARAADLARELMASTMRDQWNGIGWQNIVAQTRIASSYGLLQMLYTTATGERKYPTGSENRPEDINDTKTCMDFSMKQLDDLVKKAVRSKLGGSQNDWPGGFEGAFRDCVYRIWNTKKAYPRTILSNSLNHMPKP